MSDPSLVRFRAVVARGARAPRVAPPARSTTSTSSPSPTATRATTWRSPCGPCSTSSTASAPTRSDRLIDEIGRDEIVESVARAALLGARGNSGVILSQLIRGAAEELVSRPGELVDPVLIGAAMARAAQRAYGSVRQPAEGTILTVAARHGDERRRPRSRTCGDTRLGSDGDPAIQNALIADVLERALRRGRGVRPARARPAAGPARERRRRRRRPRADGHRRRHDRRAARHGRARGRDPGARRAISYPQHDSSTYRYCTNFAVTGRDLDPRGWIAPLEALGDSVLVVGDAATLKIHVHTDDPRGRDRPVSRRRARSRTSTSRTCTRRSLAPLGSPRGGGRGRAAAQQRCGALAVVAGAGLRQLYESLGVWVLDGGQTLNPSTYELLAGDPRRARGRGRRPAELAERRDGRRARGRAVGEGRARQRRRARSRRA